jgi:hypothetical protein
MVVVCAIGVWTLSPRFGLDTPSLVDDWWAIDRSPHQASVAIRFGNPEDKRYRPGLILWSYVQWHTFDAPRGLVGPNVWNVARLLVLVVGLCLLTTLALPPPRGTRDSVILAGLAALPALLVVTVPSFAVDLARFGPQEPLLVGAMALGGSLLALAVQALLTDSGDVPRLRTALLAVAGSAFWIIGVYQKEASLCVLPFVAAAALAGRMRLKIRTRFGLGRRITLLAVGAVVLLPLVHVAVETVLITRRGDLVYDAKVDGGLGPASGFSDLIEHIDEHLTVLATVVIAGAIVAVFAASLVTRTLNKLAVGALLSGILALLFAGQAGVVSRYYLPTFALAAVAFSLALALFRRRERVIGLVVVAALGLLYAPGARDKVEAWAGGEREWAEFVRSVSEVEASGCTVAAAGFELETSEALPVLVALGRREEPSGCSKGETYLVVGPNETGAALLQVCVSDALSTIRDWPSGSVYRCEHLATEAVRDPEFGLLEPKELIVHRRLKQL